MFINYLSSSIGQQRIFRTHEALMLWLQLMVSPILIGISILVKRSSSRPVFFRQQRHKFDGQLIEIYKFRSMKMHSDADVVQQATKEDSRVTKIGITEFFHSKVMNEFSEYKTRSDVIIANCMINDLQGVADNVYSRDLIGLD